MQKAKRVGKSLDHIEASCQGVFADVGGRLAELHPRSRSRSHESSEYFRGAYEHNLTEDEVLNRAEDELLSRTTSKFRKNP